ncbi:MAG: LysM peptidoglycan-binding domain-containing protein [Alphaproteobacteria bacterium]|nr:LysM peptidoglycan-binding domain-containing protein [Alphaproteobacteria bacterium]
MSDPGSPARRPGVARPTIAVLLGVGVVAGGAWVAARHMGGAAPDAPPPVTPAALSRPQPAPMPTAQQAVAATGNGPTLSLDGPGNAGASGGGSSSSSAAAAPPDKTAPADGGSEPAHRATAADKPAPANSVATAATPAGADTPSANPARSDSARADAAPADSGAAAAAGHDDAAAPAGRRRATTLRTVGMAEAPADAGDAAPPPQEAASTPQRPSFDIVRVTPRGETVVAGRARPNTEVALLDNGRPIAHAQADPSGQFVLLPDKPLPAGGQELSLQSQAPGEKPVTGEAPAILVVPETGPAARSDHSRSATAPSSPGALAVLTPPEGAPVVLQAPEGEKPSPAGQVALTAVDYDEHGGIRFAGTARPGGRVRVYVDNVAIGDAAADRSGRWSLLPAAAAVGSGPHRLRADEMGAHGQVLSRVELPFERATFAAADLHAGRVVVQPRQSLWRIARMVYGRGIHYTVIYAANRDQIRDPNRIYPGQLFTLPADPELAGASSAKPAPQASSATR